MPHGDPFAHIGSAGGATGQPSPVVPRYVEGRDDRSGRTSGETAVSALPAKPGGQVLAKTITVDYTSSPGVCTCGMDPMVSQAAVIHELAYGRMSPAVSKSAGGTGYPVSRGVTVHGLDLVV